MISNRKSSTWFNSTSTSSSMVSNSNSSKSPSSSMLIPPTLHMSFFFSIPKIKIFFLFVAFTERRNTMISVKNFIYAFSITSSSNDDSDNVVACSFYFESKIYCCDEASYFRDNKEKACFFCP